MHFGLAVPLEVAEASHVRAHERHVRREQLGVEPVRVQGQALNGSKDRAWRNGSAARRHPGGGRQGDGVIEEWRGDSPVRVAAAPCLADAAVAI